MKIINTLIILLALSVACGPSAKPGTPDASSIRPDEAILILEPNPGARLVNSVHVAGMADTTFEQNLVVRLLLDDGSELALIPTTIQAEMGKRGAFSVDIPFTVEDERQGFIHVFAASPRDGGITHLASVGVTLAGSGESQVSQIQPYTEYILIYQPETGGTVQGGVAHVEGFALASFEQNLVVEVLDTEGKVIGSQSVIVQSDEMGIPGPFSTDVVYTLSTPGAGRIVVRDPSPAFDGNVHLASVEVTLEP